jgi:hypothetical protein
MGEDNGESTSSDREENQAELTLTREEGLDPAQFCATKAKTSGTE